MNMGNKWGIFEVMWNGEYLR